MSIANWLRGREASLTELKEQASAASDAHGEALAGVDAAEHEFDDKGTDAAAKSLQKAREVASLAGEHVARARRLLEAGEARAAEAERQRLMARKAELEKLLSATALKAEAAPFIEAELGLLMEVAQCRARRIARGAELRSLEVELLQTRRTLGEAVEAWMFSQATNPLASAVAIGELFDERCRVLDEPLRSLLRTLKPNSESYAPNNSLPIYAPQQPVKR